MIADSTSGRARALRAGDVQLYRLCDVITEPLIYLMLLFSPWAFGTTQPWSIWTMNVAGYSLGALLIVKLAIRRLKGYRPPRWDEAGQSVSPLIPRVRRNIEHRTSNIEHPTSNIQQSNIQQSNNPTIQHPSPIAQPGTLAALTGLILGYCLISAVNAASTYHAEQLSFEYHNYLKWLPHSFDSGRTWFAFWSYLGLACSFWAVRDWLLGKSSGEDRAEHQRPEGRGQGGDRPRDYRTTEDRTRSQRPVISGQTTDIEGQCVGKASQPASSGGDSAAAEGVQGSRFPVSAQSSHLPSSNLCAPLIPTRLRRLLWVLAVNGGLLALEGIVQRLEGSGTLLFLVRPRVNPEALSQFGPYAYRANAAQYFNLLWPVCLGFWWTLHRSGRSSAHHLLLVCTTLMAACPIISTSRGGALITVGIGALAALFLLGAHFFLGQPGRLRVRGRRSEGRVGQRVPPVSGTGDSEVGQRVPPVIPRIRRNIQHRTSNIEHPTIQQSNNPTIQHPSPIAPRPATPLVLLALCFAASLGLGYAFGWKALKPRMAQLSENYDDREQMYDSARPMAADYPLFGTGPGTFESVFQLYRISTDTYWPAQLHNDWLETRITFGWLGSALIGLAFVAVVLRWFAPGGIHGGRRFTCLIWLALAGCLVHARFDFPFQVYSIVLLFLALCAVLFNLSRR